MDFTAFLFTKCLKSFPARGALILYIFHVLIKPFTFRILVISIEIFVKVAFICIMIILTKILNANFLIIL